MPNEDPLPFDLCRIQFWIARHYEGMAIYAHRHHGQQGYLLAHAVVVTMVNDPPELRRQVRAEVVFALEALGYAFDTDPVRDVFEVEPFPPADDWTDAERKGAADEIETVVAAARDRLARAGWPT